MRSQDIVGEALGAVLPQHDKVWFKIPHLLRLNLILLIPLLSSAVAGYDGSLMNGLQALPDWKNRFGNPTGHILGAVNAAQSAGSILALPFVGACSDRFGRKPTLLVGAIIIVVASIIQCLSVNYGMFVFSRVVVGVGSIMVVQPSPMLISEVCYPTHRGKYTSLYWTMYYLGAIVAAWSTYGTQKNLVGSQWSWRAPSIVQAAFPLIQIAFWWFLPESPRWLISKGRDDEATQILAKYHTGGDVSHPLVQFEREEIINAIALEKAAQKSSWASLYQTPGNRKRMALTLAIGFFSQWNGASVVSYYLTLILDTVGVTDPDTQTLINGLLQLFNFAAAIAASFLVDRLGRRALFNWSGLGMLASFIVVTACSATFANTGNSSTGIAVIAFIFIFFFHYDIAYTPLVISYPTEILPFNIRSKGLSIELAVIYTSLVVLSFVNPIALEAASWRYYIMFLVILAVSCITAWFFFPETKGYSLEEIAEIFDGQSPLPDQFELESGKDKGVAVHVDENVN
ncbi:MFS sugar transporter-like protein [Aureobasidium pullulans]|uniref:MFS sugar transporter-like protein n=1 Tax=Aureobasidium pullulans TaxID=5580 RepID=A0A4S9J243_AURPU|nr:MFS sugar transporter-like protein [Aureobasidium pullulans]TIA35846.1 MFS sugar transporter-like protein [Aureobasidium pullulans]